MVEHLPHHPKVKGLSPAAATGNVAEEDVRKKILNPDNESGSHSSSRRSPGRDDFERH